MPRPVAASTTSQLSRARVLQQTCRVPTAAHPANETGRPPRPASPGATSRAAPATGGVAATGHLYCLAPSLAVQPNAAFRGCAGERPARKRGAGHNHRGSRRAPGARPAAHRGRCRTRGRHRHRGAWHRQRARLSHALPRRVKQCCDSLATYPRIATRRLPCGRACHCAPTRHAPAAAATTCRARRSRACHDDNEPSKQGSTR